VKLNIQADRRGMTAIRAFTFLPPRRLLSCGVRVRYLTFVRTAREELHHDNGVRVEQPALPGGTGSRGKPADKEHLLPAEGGCVSNPEPMLTRKTCA
jgi:hypothetical protein